MIGRKTVLGLSLLCAFVFSAIAVQSASAAPVESNNTTAVTCVKQAKATFKFKDADCSVESAEKGTKGEFEHVALTTKSGEATAIEGVKVGANPILIGEAFGVKAEVECKKAVTSEATVVNTESEKKHKVSGQATTTFSEGCTVTNQKNCTVKEPIKAVTIYRGVDGEVAKGGKEEMGTEFKPKTGTTFTTLEFSGAFCLLPAKAEVTGTATATGVGAGKTPTYSGSTLKFTKAMTEETLKFAGNPASFTLESTVKMTESGNPISLTTAT
jgi:hypothetical protein